MKKIFTAILIVLVAMTLKAADTFYVKFDSVANNLCGGGSEAQIHASAHGGTAPYDFTWTKMFDPEFLSKEQSPSGLSRGIYHCDIYDANQTLVVLDTLVIDPPRIEVSVSRSKYGEYEISEYGAHDGFIEIMIVYGGTGDFRDFTYEWTNKQDWTMEGIRIDSLTAGDYYLTASDTNGCMNIYYNPYTMTQPGPESVIDTIPVYDTTFVTMYDTVDVIKFTEVADIANFTDPISGATFWVQNYGDQLMSSEQFETCKVYSLTGSLVKQVNLSSEVPVSDLDKGIYLFYFKFSRGEIVQRFYIE